MASLNKVILIGNLGKDPEIITFENGTKKMSVSLATTESYRDKDGNWQEQTEWHNLVNFGQIAQDIADRRRNYIKGDSIYVEGRIKTRQYVDAQNVTRYVTEILVDKMMSLGGGRIQQDPNASYNAYATQQQ
ncbi:MAG: single-stranded DNA-binding protein [Bacteroidia bacterium]|nr:single-stranded DNA-binding protein [Bacteroidia bacterium]